MASNFKFDASTLRKKTLVNSSGGGGNILDGEFAFVLTGGSAFGLPVEQSLAILVELQLGDHDLGGVDTHVDGRAIDLLPGDPLDMDDPFLTVPRTTITSSSFRTGIERTLYLFRRSDERGALISTLRSLDGAVKCAFRHFRRELETRGLYFILFELDDGEGVEV
nr:Os11g0151100 [Ipomoea batatas]